VRLGRDLSAAEAPFTAASVASAVAAVMPAFELIEDRKADYKDPDQTNAFSLVAENGWNAGAVLGTPSNLGQGRSLVGIEATLRRNGVVIHTGMTEDPFAALAWVGNSALARGYAMCAGSVVITGSVIPTLVSVQAGDRLEFELADLGSTALAAV
jgi:2-keto-4-pentenoate hydratase